MNSLLLVPLEAVLAGNIWVKTQEEGTIDLTIPAECEDNGREDCRLAGPILSREERQPLVGLEGEGLKWKHELVLKEILENIVPGDT